MLDDGGSAVRDSEDSRSRFSSSCSALEVEPPIAYAGIVLTSSFVVDIMYEVEVLFG